MRKWISEQIEGKKNKVSEDDGYFRAQREGKMVRRKKGGEIEKASSLNAKLKTEDEIIEKKKELQKLKCKKKPFILLQMFRDEFQVADEDGEEDGEEKAKIKMTLKLA